MDGRCLHGRQGPGYLTWTKLNSQLSEFAMDGSEVTASRDSMPGPALPGTGRSPSATLPPRSRCDSYWSRPGIEEGKP